MDQKENEFITEELKSKLRKLLREIKDFPKPGIKFQDISTLLIDGNGFKLAIDALACHFKDQKIDKIAGFEARGFLFSPLSYLLGVGFVMLRKPGKLPGEKISMDYGKEYGKDIIELSTGLIKEGERVLLIDDLLATGGTALAGAKLVRQVGAIPIACFLIELDGLGGAELLKKEGIDSWSLIHIEKD